MYFLLGRDGSVVAFQQTGQSWAAVLAFSSQESARKFVRQSGIEAAEIAAISRDDRAAISELVKSVKQRAVRNVLLDLDYASGACNVIEFEGDGLGPAREHQIAKAAAIK